MQNPKTDEKSLNLFVTLRYTFKLIKNHEIY
jgi:hypothetical protein